MSSYSGSKVSGIRMVGYISWFARMFMDGDEEMEPRSGEQRTRNASIHSSVFLETLVPSYQNARCQIENT